MEHVLSYMTFIPLAGAVVVLLLPGKSHNLIRWVAAVFTAPLLVMAMWLFATFDPAKTGFQFFSLHAFRQRFDAARSPGFLFQQRAAYFRYDRDDRAGQQVRHAALAILAV